MKKFRFTISLLAALTCASAAYGQKWEVGGGVGGSFSTSETVKNAALSGDASLSNGLAASFWLGNNSTNRWGGELRYDYEKTDLKLSSNGTNVTFGADTHAFHYDLLYHFTSIESRVRPFVAAGGGVKLFRGSGNESAYQPLSNLALLTKTNEIKPLVSVGGGLKMALSSTLQLRLEAHDYLTPFPKNVIAPAQGSKIGGFLQDFVVMVGLSASF